MLLKASFSLFISFSTKNKYILTYCCKHQAYNISNNIDYDDDDDGRQKSTHVGLEWKKENANEEKFEFSWIYISWHL